MILFPSGGHAPKAKILLIILLMISITAHAQKLTTELTDARLRELNEEQQIDYVIENFYAIYSADFDNALSLTRKMARLAHQRNLKDKEAYCLMDEGVVLFLKGDYDNALPQYLKSHHLFDSLKDNKGLAFLSNEMSVFYSKQSNNKKAYEFIEQAISNSTKINNKEALATALGHKATLLHREGKTDEAFAFYNDVYKIRLEEKDSVGLGYALLDLANIALEKGDLKKAISYIEQSTELRERIGDDQGIAVNLVNTGEAYYQVKDYPQALSYFTRSLEKALSIGYTDLVRYDYDQIAMTYVNLGDYKSAYANQHKSQLFKDSLFNIDRTKVMSDLQVKYETEKKEQQITLQQSQIRFNYAIIASLMATVGLVVAILFLVRSRLKRERELSVREAFINATIASQESERKRFAQDLHDGMGQLISSLRLSIGSLGIQADLHQRIDVVSKSERILNDMHHEIRSIAFNLMPHTLIQYGLTPALKEMAARVTSTGTVMATVSDFDLPERLSEVQEISVYRIIQEWVNNILKYAHATKIEIQLVGHGREIAITIEDNGKGFDAGTLEAGTGNGWRNIQSRANLVKGILNIDSNPARAGSTLSLQIPVEVADVKV